MRRNVITKTTHLICRRGHRYTSSNVSAKSGGLLWRSETFPQRLEELKRNFKDSDKPFPASLYPRIPQRVVTGVNAGLTAAAQPTANQGDLVTVVGRVHSVRKHGSKLVFVDLRNGEKHDQIMCNYGKLQNGDEATKASWKRFVKTVQEGDHYSFSGHVTHSSTNEKVVEIEELPVFLSPSLHQIPVQINDPQTQARFPQLELMTPEKKQLILLRHKMEQGLQAYLNSLDFVKVTTPILAAHSGGAVAKPFATIAQRLADHPLYMRIAQELELKKMIAAGIPKVYELGQVFRNEGLDATHNPEFTMCELYQAYASIETILERVETLFTEYWAPQSNISAVKELFHDKNVGFARLEFLPTLEAEMRKRIPSFSLPSVINHDTWKELVPHFEALSIPSNLAGDNPTTAHVLDVLSSHLVEPLCTTPTYLMYYPAIMSPLAKSFTCAETGHELAAQAELFINSTEYANMYEEENDPFLQARKFLLQRLEIDPIKGLTANDVSTMSHDTVMKNLSPSQRYYVRVLEMGLPPTGGIGIGIDRAVMLFGGVKRIGDVLPFGNLRNVVAMGT